jgi:hypothetical protein
MISQTHARHRFGTVHTCKVFRHKLVLTNVGVELARFRVKQPAAENLSVVYNPGALAPGMSLVLEVEVYVDEVRVCMRAACICACDCVHVHMFRNGLSLVGADTRT